MFCSSINSPVLNLKKNQWRLGYQQKNYLLWFSSYFMKSQASSPSLHIDGSVVINTNTSYWAGKAEWFTANRVSHIQLSSCTSYHTLHLMKVEMGFSLRSWKWDPLWGHVLFVSVKHEFSVAESSAVKYFEINAWDERWPSNVLNRQWM